MSFNYQLFYKGDSIDLFKSHTNYYDERSLIREMLNMSQTEKFNLAEAIIKMLFSKFETIDHESSDPLDNLKTLLAHGFEILNSTTNLKLNKSYSPITFSMYAETVKSICHFGHFYFERDQNISAQFIKFCRVTDYPPDIKKHIILQVLMSDGGSLVASNDLNKTILIKRDPTTNTITGCDEVIQFFSDPIRQKVS